MLRNSTVTGNGSARRLDASAGGGGIAIDDDGRDPAEVVLASSIVAGNHAGAFAGGVAVADDIRGAVTASDGRNVFGTEVEGAVSGDALDASPDAIFAQVDSTTGGGRLALEGGPTPTVALLDTVSNPALSGADPGRSPDVDQRGRERPAPDDTNPDIGAFELDQDSVSRSATDFSDVLSGTTGDDRSLAQLGNDLVRGGIGADRLRGNGGADTLLGGPGRDDLGVGTGLDILAGGTGRDQMSGGDGADRFVIDDGETGGGPGKRDIIGDLFDRGDVIDLVGIDADTSRPGDQPFSFIGPRRFIGEPGELRFRPADEFTAVVQGDTDGDRGADIAILVTSTFDLRENDFVL